ncbi:OLC1v1016773C2 [Oldenlandia corymbosa var. corymbosa]|uniref:OLC1v1016773C2 n=1 Tax=Oldenlandia corymbosa var. corymbosa TaxID=529605 RepID=A0AAV1E7X5_OLDCO|nr:OLC1v1016773C2 [Oldenlandia corymbosa var. corymbosa]
MPPELAAFQDRRTVSGFRTRDISPDSVIFPADSNFSIFSSNSASVDRCSFASDVPDQDSSVSDNYQHLAGHELRESSAASSGGPYVDLDPHDVTVRNKNSVHLTRKEKPKVQELESSEVETEDDNSVLDSARSSFSQALKECQDRRSRPDAVKKKQNRQRPASLDFNNAVNTSSPRLGVLKKTSVLNPRTGTFPSPGTPNYRHKSVGMQKGWSSERVPLPNNTNRRNASALVPYNNNGRTLPSKWEDAERWIFSPVSGDSQVRHSVQQAQRRPKSKSGPLGPPGIAYHNMYSPAAPVFETRNVEHDVASSPFSAGVMMADGLPFQCNKGGYGGLGNFPAFLEPCMARSISIHGCSELISQSSLPGFQEEKLDGGIPSDANVSRTISRRDMATQMSPESSKHSSPGRTSSFSPTTAILPIVEVQSVHNSRPEVRDVQVDEQVTMTRWPKKNRTRIPGRGSGNSDDWKRKAVEIRTAGWDVSDTAKAISKLKREEAKINAWENLQKAKAEAAIRKLEMKLEKKRSSSMDRIMNKLRSAQKKAQEMRSSVLSNQSQQITNSPVAQLLLVFDERETDCTVRCR